MTPVDAIRELRAFLAHGFTAEEAPPLAPPWLPAGPVLVFRVARAWSLTEVGRLPTKVDNRKLKKVALHHLSWTQVLTEAVMQKEQRGVVGAHGGRDGGVEESVEGVGACGSIGWAARRLRP